MFSLTLTILMALKALHMERSTLLHSPARVHILSMVVMPLGQGRVWVMPAGVSGQKRNPVCSESQKTAGSGPVSIGRKERYYIMCTQIVSYS